MRPPEDYWMIITKTKLPPFRKSGIYSPSDWRGYTHPIKGHGKFKSLESAIYTAKGLLNQSKPALWIYHYRAERRKQTRSQLSRIVWCGTAVDRYNRPYNFTTVYNPWTATKSFAETISGYWKW